MGPGGRGGGSGSGGSRRRRHHAGGAALPAGCSTLGAVQLFCCEEDPTSMAAALYLNAAFRNAPGRWPPPSTWRPGWRGGPASNGGGRTAACSGALRRVASCGALPARIPPLCQANPAEAHLKGCGTQRGRRSRTRAAIPCLAAAGACVVAMPTCLAQGRVQPGSGLRGGCDGRPVPIRRCQLAGGSLTPACTPSPWRFRCFTKPH